MIYRARISCILLQNYKKKQAINPYENTNIKEPQITRPITLNFTPQLSQINYMLFS
jgi:hypothetical protein